MASSQNPHQNVGHQQCCPKFRKKIRRTYCILCRKYYLKAELHEHMHSMLHHRELDKALGTNSYHMCQACQTHSMGLNEYAEHISTAQHKAKFTILTSSNIKAYDVFKTLDKDATDRIRQRNKMLKKQERKTMKKKKKKQKQAEGQKHAQMQQEKKTVTSKATKPKKSRQSQLRISNQVQETHHNGSNNAVFQNKENSLQRSLHYADSALQDQSGRFVFWTGEPAGRTWHHPHVGDQFTTPTHHMRYDSNFSVSNQFSKAAVGSSQTDRHLAGPHKPQWDAAYTTQQIQLPDVSQPNYRNGQYSCGTYRDFPSDCFPRNGVIIFDRCQGESSGSSQPRQECSRGSDQPASADKSANAAPIRDVDVSAMLKQIRRVLGVREPCRADREARRQNAAQQAGGETERRAGVSFRSHVTSASAVPPPQVNGPAAPAAVCPSTVPPAKPKPTVFKTTQETTQYHEKSSVATGGLSDSRQTESQVAVDSWTSPNRSTVKATSFEPKSNSTRKVRIAHKPTKAQGDREVRLKPTLNKLLSLSGARSKLSWSQMCDNMRRKKLKSMPRFGIKFVNPPVDQERSTQPQDSDLPLSEGFHWESIPDSPSALDMTFPPAPPPQTTAADRHTETQSETQIQEPLEEPDAAQTRCSSQTAAGLSVKVEPKLDDEYEVSTNSGVPSNRKHKMLADDGIPDQEPRGKKKKTKSNKDSTPMEQLLVVSLREEELSHSLQDLDKSLFQARNALQAAYTEVQRLMLLRHQFTTEVNDLRAKRIEILQEMQEGYTGASGVVEKATTSSAPSAAAAVQPPVPLSSGAFPTSSSQQSPATTPASSVPQPQPAPLALSGKQEMVQQPAAGQTSYSANTVSCKADAPQVSMNQAVPLFPPSLLLQPSHLTTPTSGAASAQQPTAECSTSVKTPPPPESPARQQKQEKQKGLKGCIQTATLAEETHPAERISEEAVNHNKEQVELREPVADKSVPERESSAAIVIDEGNQSDGSVELIDPSNCVVIDIVESDNEDPPEKGSDVPVQPEPPQNSASTQTFQQSDSDRKVKPPAMTAKEEKTPAEPVEDEEPSVGAFENHTGPVLGLQVHDGLLYTCSGDNTARAYSLASRECQAVFEGHTNKINCLLVSSLPNMPTRLYTGSSDQTVRCYSIKSKKCLELISLPDRVLCLHIAWNILYVGLASGSVGSYDLKTLKQLDVFECHGPRGVSCLGTTQEGARRLLLVGSYDSTISVRDAKSGLLLRSLEGHTKTVLCLKVVNDLVFSGSSDTSVHAHNIHTGELIRIYKGHGHAVTSIVILGKVMVTACLDKLVRVYELQSHDRLQVYGGHSDMVMCMSVHRSVIYTGCYDGSVQAVKLNLMQNYRCWWQNCSLIFGISDHLVQHLVGDHTNPSLQTVKCRWRSCDAFFPTRQSVKEELPEHMQSHVTSDSEMQP
ncbi:zinc finger protein 106-like [Stegastes partitus]|uniref:Zinc finger protein 106-like n=1 Tax=Stegastes partitus TaxID=144197 RepID=A0A3B5BL34_9TELE|nr:PREDICTED: zinc finger protein 106-like [Stegastes partitus]